MQQQIRGPRRTAALGLGIVAIAATAACSAPVYRAAARQLYGASFREATVPLVTGKSITPRGTQAGVGSIPIDLVLSPDGKYALVSSMGDRAFVSVVNVADGSVVSRVGFNDPKESGTGRQREGLYYGIACGPVAADGTTPVYAARGSDKVVSVLKLGADGKLTDTSQELDAGDTFVAGLATDSKGQRLYVADNAGDPMNSLKSVLRIMSSADGKAIGTVSVPGYPYAVAAVTLGPNADRKVYVSSEQSGGVSVVDPGAGNVTKEIVTGEHPLGLLLNRAQDRLYVANSGSDTVSVVRTDRDRVERTILLRPADARGLPETTPIGLALSPDEKTLYVALADLNAVGVVDVQSGTVAGYIPVGWYPTSVAASPDGKRLFVANAKGVVVRTPNNKPVPVAAGERGGKYIEAILEGTVSTIDLGAARANLTALTTQVLANNRIVPDMLQQARTALSNPGIEHVIYIIKENRTYDQVLGDVTEGNGDPSLTMFGKNVTPNEHALARRFVLLDNFYCCSEVSADGWTWSTQGMANPYVIRNVPYSYTGHERSYDYNGTNNGVAPELNNMTDVARAPGGSLWDIAAKRHVSMRNYACFTVDQPAVLPPGADPSTVEDVSTKKNLVDVTDTSYRRFDMNYADSEAYVKLGVPPTAKQLKTFGKFSAPSRFTEWKREFDGYVAHNNLPQLTLIGLGDDHTGGTSPGGWSPSAMVADNDYAFGQIVEAVSHSPYWKTTALFVLEDDGQSGNDHVDCHRSIAFVISPFVPLGTHDSRFYNTDSVLHSIENLLHLDPMCGYDAVAPTLNVFSAGPTNDAPYTAILPDRSILTQANTRRSYRAQDSLREFPPQEADAGSDAEMTDIVWHAVMGRNVPVPPVRTSTAFGHQKLQPDGDASTAPPYRD